MNTLRDVCQTHRLDYDHTMPRRIEPIHKIFRPWADNWDGPLYRPLVCGITREVKLLKPSALFLGAMEPCGVWIYTLKGYAHHKVDQKRYLLHPGRMLATFEPAQAWLEREQGGLPWHYLWIHVTGETAMNLFTHLVDQFGPLLDVSQTSSMVIAANKLIRAAQVKPHRSGLEWSALTYNFLTAWWQTALDQQPKTQDDYTPPSPSRLLSIEPRTITNFAQQMGYSRQHMQILLKNKWDRTPGLVLREVRLKEAARLLHSTNLKINVIAERIGYANSATLSRAFANVYHVSPSAYRHQVRQKSTASSHISE